MFINKMEKLEAKKQDMQEKLSELDSGIRTIAHVLPDKCAGCGLCTDVCPNLAISVENHHAVIDSWLCCACCACVQECPHEAITIMQKAINQ